MEHDVEVVDMPMELSVFDPVDVQIQEAKEKNANLVFDYNDKDGNKEARSWVAHLRKLKRPVNETHALGKAEALTYCRKWDEAKNKRIKGLEDMIEHHYKFIREIEEAETLRLAENRLRVQREEEAKQEKARLELEAREKAVRDDREALDKEKEKIARAEREKAIAEEAKKSLRREPPRE